jgi:hypothetical protein
MRSAGGAWNPQGRMGKPGIFKIGTALIGIILAVAAAVTIPWVAEPQLNWPDRRPIGALFLADYGHRSARNPRGWFNAPALDVMAPGGPENFRKALLAYADRSIEILKAVRAQGMIVWDLEGEEFPQRTSYIGDPRLMATLAPEMAPVADEFFRRFRDAGLRVGMTVRPQQLVIDRPGQVRQTAVRESGDLLLKKIDYGRQRWGATLFYIDSNSRFHWPGELFSFSRLARQRPDVLLIPEHHQPMYYSFCAPYAAIRQGGSATSAILRLLNPRAFQVLNVADAAEREEDIAAAYRNGDVLLFPAWYWGRESNAVKSVTY